MIHPNSRPYCRKPRVTISSMELQYIQHPPTVMPTSLPGNSTGSGKGHHGLVTGPTTIIVFVILSIIIVSVMATFGIIAHYCKYRMRRMRETDRMLLLPGADSATNTDAGEALAVREEGIEENQQDREIELTSEVEDFIQQRRAVEEVDKYLP